MSKLPGEFWGYPCPSLAPRAPQRACSKPISFAKGHISHCNLSLQCCKLWASSLGGFGGIPAHPLSILGPKGPPESLLKAYKLCKRPHSSLYSFSTVMRTGGKEKTVEALVSFLQILWHLICLSLKAVCILYSCNLRCSVLYFFFLCTLVFLKKPVCYIAQEGKFARKIRYALVGCKQWCNKGKAHNKIWHLVVCYSAHQTSFSFA